jgi:hypothetical protein
MALVSAQLDEMVKLKDFGAGAKTLAFHLEPKVKNFNTLSVSEIPLQSMWRLLVFTGVICFFLLYRRCRQWSSECPCTAMDVRRKFRSTSPRWKVLFKSFLG